MTRTIRRTFLSWFVYFAYRMLVATWRIRVVESEGLQKYLQSHRPVVFAHWHGDELAIIHLVRRYRLATMTSTSADGSIVDYAIRKLGGATARGSSTRGGAGALIGLIRLVRDGRNASVAVDGPRGPIYVPKPGVFELSRIARAPIIPTGVAVRGFHRFEKSWNKTYLPFPFAKVTIYLGEPLPLPEERTREQDADSPGSSFSSSLGSTAANQLKAAIDAAQQEAAKIIAAC